MSPPSVSALFEKDDDWIFYIQYCIFSDTILAANKCVFTGQPADFETGPKKNYNFNNLHYLPKSISGTPQYFLSNELDLWALLRKSEEALIIL